MNAWVLRAVGLGALVVVLRAVLGFAMVYWPTHGAWMRVLCLILLLAAVVYWGILDGRRDRAVHVDPEHGSDLTILWLKAAVGAGLGSGLVAWLLDFLPRFDLGDNGLLFELTASASAIILVVFLPALLGVAIGRWVAGRKLDNGAQVNEVDPPTQQLPAVTA
ncbi:MULTISPECIES: B-4DMT family transporter [unclassified Nocardia]|uniref:B-4DMT family transporter n=1 Tax=unclassified Nocardia TaxID=2637762 RepID=UPI001CE49D75|nr:MULTISPECIES: B-4DMT family transporter [unclassified Nocardia]